jgi:hypothetical protein
MACLRTSFSEEVVMKGFKSVVVMATAALVAAIAAPVGAIPSGATVESYKIDGMIATGQWGDPGEPEVGMPRAIYVQGADAIATHRVSGSKPVREQQQSGVAFATTLLDGNGDPYFAEVWGFVDDAEFTISSDLTAASMSFDCDALIVIWDPVLGEEVVSEETMPLSVMATWTGDGTLTSIKDHSKYTEEGLFSIDRAHGTTRPATVELTLTGPGGVLFDGTMDYGEMSDVTGASMVHMLP